MVAERVIFRKVPEVTALFWVIKLLTTALGESTSDYLVNDFNPYIAVVCCTLLFVGALALQFWVRRYVPWVYWLAIVMVAVFGTMAADVLHVVVGVPYWLSSSAFAVALVVVFWLWYRVEGTLSIHSITTTRREIFYWAAVSAAFALGTAAGDLLAYTANLGFLAAGLVFAVLFLAPGVGWRAGWFNSIAAFWISYVLTRPLGASFADWTGKGQDAGGLGWGDGPVAAVLAVLIVVSVGYLQLRQRKTGELEPVGQAAE
ncbi:COG4705 family protein [Sinomonas humi]|uniref:Membrane protein n=1 Tax=Sinomonas humi TaxID=1338436 RepID=A0A0B2AEG3_9MICC|nr:membrane protein [Sinomonas humi]KHL01919.1 membrane protein [Sinomonas humi]